MAEGHISYESWQTLDDGKRYCIVDTMALLQVYRRDRRLASMVEAVRDGRTMLLVPEIVDECAAVFGTYKPDTSSPEYLCVGDASGNICDHLAGPLTEEDLDVEPQSRGDFDRILVETLRGWGIDFVPVRPEPATIERAERLHTEAPYPNKAGEPLSAVDCIILRLAIENPNVDILTDDSALRRAVLAECGGGRASRVLADYFGRLNMTARFFSAALKKRFVDCNPVRSTIEYRDAGTRWRHPLPPKSEIGGPETLAVVSFSHGLGASWGVDRNGIGRERKNNAVDALLSFVRLVVLEWYCACGDRNWARLDREWNNARPGSAMQAKKTRGPHYNTAKRILDQYRGRYCACSRPDKRAVHKEFKTIMSEVD